eukprot:6482131-Amphidinium_carterae.1
MCSGRAKGGRPRGPKAHRQSPRQGRGPDQGREGKQEECAPECPCYLIPFQKFASEKKTEGRAQREGSGESQCRQPEKEILDPLARAQWGAEASFRPPCVQ